VTHDNPYDGMISLPDRVAGSMTGSSFGSSIHDVPLGAARERAILQQILAGNTPTWMSMGKPVPVSWNNHYAVFWALPDYLCVGSNDDYLRCPVNPLTAQQIADAVGGALPTRKMVNAIWKMATVQLEPIPFPPGSEMTTTPYFLRHNVEIQKQLTERPFGALVAGHKKDIVVCKDLRAGRVAIYGWHHISGAPIQPLNAVSHDCYYADYSHGARLVSKSVYVDDQRYMDVGEILQSSELYGLLSDEGPLERTEYGDR